MAFLFAVWKGVNCVG